MSDVLEDALATLRYAFQEFSRDAPLSLMDPTERLKSLSAAVQSLGCERPLKPRHCPDEYREQWREYLAGRRADLERVAVRFLCWELEVGTHPRFHEYLDKVNSTLPARALQGLIASAHQRWSSDLIEGPVGASLRKRIQSYDGANQRIAKWRRDVAMVAGGNGPFLLGKDLVEKVCPVEEACTRCGFIEDSAYTRSAVAAATRACGEQLTVRSPRVAFLTDQLLGWKGWEEGPLKAQIADWILSQQAVRLEELREGIKRLALDRLGDPRLARNAGRWVGMRKAAQDEFLKWLSREDIVFFFERLLPQGSDPHGRKDFWLKYVNRVRRSRPLLCPDDQYRLRSDELRNPQKLGHFGKVEGSSSDFLLDFGEVLVVEFSVVGNACYLYDRAGAAKAGVGSDFWKPNAFSVSDLKRQRSSVGHMTHHRSVWREKMAKLLAGYGIRPGV